MFSDTEVVQGRLTSFSVDNIFMADEIETLLLKK